MNKIILIVFVALIAIATGLFLFGGDKEASQKPMLADNEMVEKKEKMEEMMNEGMEEKMEEMMGEVKEFTISGSNFSFSQNEIRVSKGDTVRITFKNEGGVHDWKIDEFNASTKIIRTGEEETIEFVADKTGSFEYYCSVGNHRDLGMRGTLIVE